MRAPGGSAPAVRAVLVTAAVCLFVVLVAWATLIGPDEAFTGPGPRPAPAETRTESCIPLEVVTEADGTTKVVFPDDYNVRDYCEPPAEELDDYRDFVDDHPPPLWVRVLVTAALIGLLVFIAGGAILLAIAAVRSIVGRRTDQARVDVDFMVLDEPDRVAAEVVKDAEEQDALLRDGDARNAIVATWHRFEVQGARAGVPRLSSETSSEYALRLLDLAEADTRRVARLAELYREARFSDHPITESHRTEALELLVAIRRGLGVRA